MMGDVNVLALALALGTGAGQVFGNFFQWNRD